MINEAQIHLLLNHFPVLCTLLGIPILLYGWLRKQDAVVQVALAIFVLGAVTALPVYFTGEGAEETVEHLPGVMERLIESHEDLAKIAMVFVELLGLASLGCLFALPRKPEFSRWLMPVLLLISLGTAGIMAQTAHLGGQIRHSEIRSAQAGGTGGGEQNETQNKTFKGGDRDNDGDDD